MALPPGAAAALGTDMASKGMGPGPGDDGDEPEPTSPDVMTQIYGDLKKAMDAGSDAEGAKFLEEFVERVMSKGASVPGDEE